MHQNIKWIVLLTGIIVVLLSGLLIVINSYKDVVDLQTNEQTIDSSLYSPESKSWHRIDVNAFSIALPDTFYYYKQNGIDSFVGIFSDNVDTIYFDFGWYSNDLIEIDSQISADTINGRLATLAFSDKGIGVHFPDADRDNKLTLYSSTLDKELAIKIFSTIKFSHVEGFTSKKLGGNIQNFASSGKMLFQNNCRVCHDLDYVVVGPALEGIVSRTSTDWVKSWMTNPEKLIVENNQAKELYENHSKTRHPQYTFTDKEIEALIRYLQ